MEYCKNVFITVNITFIYVIMLYTSIYILYLSLLSLMYTCIYLFVYPTSSTCINAIIYHTFIYVIYIVQLCIEIINVCLYAWFFNFLLINLSAFLIQSVAAFPEIRACHSVEVFHRTTSNGPSTFYCSWWRTKSDFQGCIESLPVLCLALFC